MKIKNPFEKSIRSNHFNSMVNATMVLVFALIVVVLIKAIVGMIIPAPVTPTNFDPLFTEFMGLPYVFWVLLGVGVALGLTFHGFKLVHIETKK